MSGQDSTTFAAGVSPAAKPLQASQLQRAVDRLTNLVSILAACAFLMMAALIIVQVIFRYVLSLPLIGSEEAARIAMIFVVLVGAGLAIRSRSHMAVSYFHDRFPSLLRKACSVLIILAICTLATIMIVKGAELANRAMFQTTPALQIPKGYIVWAFPIGGSLMLLYALCDLANLMLGRERVIEKEFVE